MAPTGSIVSLARCAGKTQAGRFAERVVEGVDDGGAAERVVIWIERKEGGVWAVGRAVNPQHRPSDEPRPDDYLFEGYELQDALDAANEALEDDVSVAEGDGSRPGSRRSGAARSSGRSSAGSSGST